MEMIIFVTVKQNNDNDELCILLGPMFERLYIPSSSLFTDCALTLSAVNKKEIRPYYLRPQAGIILSLPTLLATHKWTGIETQILFLPIRKRKPGYSHWWILTQCLNF